MKPTTNVPATDASDPAKALFDLGEPVVAESPAPHAEAPRLRKPEREQGEMRVASLDQLLPPDHMVRVVWEYVAGLDVSSLLQAIRALPGQPGRDATDPRLLLALWLYATVDGVGSARELDRLCTEHLAYQWLCGGVTLNYHTLADFRTEQSAFLDRLLTESVATLLHQGLIDLKLVAQDGLRIRASAGAASFRREPSLKKCLAEAEAQVAALRSQVDEDSQAATRRQQAARERAAREKQERLQRALAEREALLALREQQKKEKGLKYEADKLRASTTDPEARSMKMADGGTRPGYNVQLATSVQGGIIVGVDVSNVGGDGGLMQPMLEQIHRRYEQRPEHMLVDGGFTVLKDIEQAESDGVQVLGPIKNETSKKAQGDDPYQPRRNDGPGVAAWRQRMGTEAAQTMYRLRAATAEWANAQIRNRGLYQVRVRGQQKVLSIALWHAVAHNMLRAWVLRQALAAD